MGAITVSVYAVLMGIQVNIVVKALTRKYDIKLVFYIAFSTTGYHSLGSLTEVDMLI